MGPVCSDSATVRPLTRAPCRLRLQSAAQAPVVHREQRRTSSTRELASENEPKGVVPIIDALNAIASH
jgi:hypothetical protein